LVLFDDELEPTRDRNNVVDRWRLMTDDRVRTVVLGFDALDFRYLDRYQLSNFDRLRTAGVEASLRSTHPPWTASAWPSAYTGVDPSHHGVYGFFRYEGYPDDATLVSRNDVAAPAVWNYCSAAGVRSVVCNVPVTHPAEPVDGVVIPGYLAAENAPGYPRGIKQAVSKAIEEPYRVYSTHETASDGAAKLDGYLDLIDLRRRAVRHLLTDRDWEFAFVQVQKTDAVFHNFDDDDAFRRVYEAADRFLGTVLDVVDEGTNVVVCSDHGMGPVEGYRVYVNEVLRRAGYVDVTTDTDRPSLGAAKKSVLLDDGTTDGTDDSNDDGLARAVSLAQDAFSRVGITPGRVYAAADRLGLGPTLVRYTPETVRRAAERGVDWRTSRAYCRSDTRLGVRINLAGRDPAGVVTREEYETVRSEVIELLSALETPDGRPAFDAVLEREAVFDGPAADRAPDVVLHPRGMDNMVSATLYDRRFIQLDKHDHKRDGVFLGVGPSFASDVTLDRLSLTDLAPVALALSGLAVPDRMTGRVPDGLLSVPVRVEDYGDVPFGTDDEVVRDDGVTERLEDLGYL
jgi:predicted AlkP superfamily phosphohydrolase/phosphomutase